MARKGEQVEEIAQAQGESSKTGAPVLVRALVHCAFGGVERAPGDVFMLSWDDAQDGMRLGLVKVA